MAKQFDLVDTVGLALVSSWPAWLVRKSLPPPCRQRFLPEDIWNLGYPVSCVTTRDCVLNLVQPSAIMAVFLFIGTAVLLYIKASYPPGPLLFATIFGCIAIGMRVFGVFQLLNSNPSTIDITITTAVLFPFPYYNVSTLCDRGMWV